MDDDAHLPIFKGRVVSYIVTADGSNISDGSASQVTEVSGMGGSGGGAANGRTGLNNHAFNGRNHHPNHAHGYNHSRRGYGTAPYPAGRIGHSVRPDDDYDDSTTTCTETESAVSSRCSRRGRGYRCGRDCDCTDSSSMVTSDMDSTSFIDSDDEDDDDEDDIDVDESASRVSTTTADTSVSRIHDSRLRRRRRMRRMMPAMSNASSVSSTMTDSTISMNVITVNLDLGPPDSFLGISLVGERGGGIYVRSIIDGGAVAADGRIETGDKILQVNDVNLERMTNDDAVELLRDAAQRHEAIKLVVLKTWEDKPPRFAIPRSEPVRPIDPGAWVAHTEAARAAGEYPIRPPSAATLASNSSSIQSSVADSERLLTMDKQILNLETVDMLTITKSMAAYDSGLDIKERDWLKIKIPDAFLGSDVVEWLFSHVQGFDERRDAKKYASQMMKQGFIRHTLNKNSFSEQCYYVFGDMINLADAVSRLRLVDDEDCDSSDRDTLITVRDGRGTGGSNSGSPWHQQRHQVAPATYTEPLPGHGFLPWSTDAVHYGTIFGPNSGSGDGIRSQQHQPNSRSGGSSSSDAERSQLSGPLPISSFKPQAGGPALLSSFTPNHLPNTMHHHYQNELQQNQYSEPNYATAVIPNDSKSSSRSNGIRNGEEIGS